MSDISVSGILHFDMNTYELTLLFAEDKEAKNKKAVTKLVTDYIAKKKGKIVKTDEWGVKPLAYPIRENKSGEYVHLVIELEPKNQPGLDKMLRLDEQMLRYLFVRV